MALSLVVLSYFEPVVHNIWKIVWRPFKHSLVEFPHPNKIDHFVHNDGDRESKLLSLSLRYEQN